MTVVRAPATVTSTSLVAGQGGSAQSGQSMTLTATVLPRDALGSVTILDRGRPVALVTVAGGQATWTAVATTGGHDFTARFTPSDPRFWTPATSRAASVIVPAVTGHAVTASPAASAAAGSASPLPQSPELSPVALESSIPTEATTNVAIVKSGSDVADLVAIAALLLLLGVGLLALSGGFKPRRRAAPERASATYRRHAR
jgi:antitoxin (DNA-binding transcriptional repressor) of toxin-antitoxin stability system